MNHRQLAALGALATLLSFVILLAVESSDDSASGPSTTTSSSSVTSVASTTSTSTTVIERANVDGVLRIGTVFPATGDSLFLNPPLVQGVRLAVAEINASGGVFGNPVELVEADSGSDPEQGAAAAMALATDDLVDVVIGAGTSEITIAVSDSLQDVDVVQCTSSATSPVLDVEGRPQLIRTIPSDRALADALAEMVAEEDPGSVVILRAGNGYTDPIAQVLSTAFDRLEVDHQDVAVEIDAPGDQATVLAAARELATDPATETADAIVVVALPHMGGAVMAALLEAGIDPSTTPVFGTDGLESSDLGRAHGVEPADLEGLRGLGPFRGDQNFLERFSAFAPNLGSTDFAAQTHDCVTAVALAAVAAGTDDADEMLAAIVEVTGGGAKCRAFSQCVSFLEAERDTDYDGDSGPLAFTPAGEIGEATFGEWRVNADGEPETVGYRGVQPVQPSAPTEGGDPPPELPDEEPPDTGDEPPPDGGEDNPVLGE